MLSTEHGPTVIVSRLQRNGGIVCSHRYALYHSNNRILTWRKRYLIYHEQNIAPIVVFGGGSVTVWGEIYLQSRIEWHILHFEPDLILVASFINLDLKRHISQVHGHFVHPTAI